MAEEKAPQFAEDDDLARARAFWNDNGKSIVFGIVMGLSGIVGFNFWQGYQEDQGEAASALFSQIQLNPESEQSREAIDSLQTDYGKSTYASLASLTVAANQVKEGDLSGAAEQLSWVLENTSDEAIGHVARIRLAAVLIANGDAQQALQLLSVEDFGTFESRYQELRGDAYRLRDEDGDRVKAKEAWEASIAASSGGAVDFVQLKIDNLGE